MDMDEMTDRISMALKDPILQQGFEIICKNLIELGKENAELKSKEYFVGDINRQNMELQQKLEEAKANLEYLLEGRDNEIDELKEKLEIEQNSKGDWFGKAVTKDRRLTEAKALLAKWVELYKPKSNTALPTPIQVDTERFLAEN